MSVISSSGPMAVIGSTAARTRGTASATSSPRRSVPAATWTMLPIAHRSTRPARRQTRPAGRPGLRSRWLAPCRFRPSRPADRSARLGLARLAIDSAFGFPASRLGSRPLAQQGIVGAVTGSTGGAAVGRGRLPLSVQPFANATGEGLCLRFHTREAAVELGDPGPLIEKQLPVLGRPTVVTSSQQSNDPGLIAGQGIENRCGWRRCGFEEQIVTNECDLDTGGPRRPQGFERCHSVALQPCWPIFPGSDRERCLASVASAPSVSLAFKELARTVDTESFRPASAPASAAPSTVCTVAALKALAPLPFGGIADDADGADDCAPS